MKIPFYRRARKEKEDGLEIRVEHFGVGPAMAAARIESLLKKKPRLLVCAGFAGGLDPELRVGALVVGRRRVDARG